VNTDAREWYALSASYKTPSVMLIYVVESDKSLVGDRGKKTST